MCSENRVIGSTTEFASVGAGLTLNSSLLQVFWPSTIYNHLAREGCGEKTEGDARRMRRGVRGCIATSSPCCFGVVEPSPSRIAAIEGSCVTTLSHRWRGAANGEPEGSKRERHRVGAGRSRSRKTLSISHLRRGRGRGTASRCVGERILSVSHMGRGRWGCHGVTSSHWRSGTLFLSHRGEGEGVVVSWHCHVREVDPSVPRVWSE